MYYCGGSCGCWSGCICDASFGGCKMYPDIDDSYDTQRFIVGVAPPRTSFVSRMRLEGDDDDNGIVGAHVKIQAI